MIPINTVRANIKAFEAYDNDFGAMFQAAMDLDGYEGSTDISYDSAKVEVSRNGVVVVTLYEAFDNIDKEDLYNVSIGITAEKTFLAY